MLQSLYAANSLFSFRKLCVMQAAALRIELAPPHIYIKSLYSIDLIDSNLIIFFVYCFQVYIGYALPSYPMKYVSIAGASSAISLLQIDNADARIFAKVRNSYQLITKKHHHKGAYHEVSPCFRIRRIRRFVKCTGFRV